MKAIVVVFFLRRKSETSEKQLSLRQTPHPGSANESGKQCLDTAVLDLVYRESSARSEQRYRCLNEGLLSVPR